MNEINPTSPQNTLKQTNKPKHPNKKKNKNAHSVPRKRERFSKPKMNSSTLPLLLLLLPITTSFLLPPPPSLTAPTISTTTRLEMAGWDEDVSIEDRLIACFPYLLPMADGAQL